MSGRTPAERALRRRRRTTGAFRAATVAALVVVVAPSAWLVISVIWRAVPNWQWSVLTTPTQGLGGGLENAILGTLWLMAGVLVLAGTVGVLGGIHLAELARPGRRGGRGSSWARMATDVLSGFPSIVLGYVGYVVLVLGLHWGFSYLPAVIVLSVMVVPYIAKSTETALRQVPTTYREGAEALGMREGHALRRVVVRGAIPGIVTGLLLALAIACGETAPLLYTAGWTNNLPSPSLLHEPVAYLTYPVWEFYNQPYKEAHALSYDAALILMVLVLVLLAGARVLVWRTQRFSEGRRR